MSGVFDQERIRVDIRLLTDVATDWVQCSIRVSGVNEAHLIALEVDHPRPLSELPSQLPRILMRVMTILRAELPGGAFRGVDEQPF